MRVKRKDPGYFQLVDRPVEYRNHQTIRQPGLKDDPIRFEIVGIQSTGQGPAGRMIAGTSRIRRRAGFEQAIVS